jgi:EAL domain-containing protein (putative c-di-GMP-specific phosphodiesterase class I)
VGNMTKENKILFEYMVKAAKHLNYETLCEGIETKDQEDFIKQVGCDYTQGFYFYKPAPIEEILKEKK